MLASLNQSTDPVSRVRLVLVAPRHPGNIGACARLAANFSVDDCVLVNPQCDWRDWPSRKFATGESREVLDSFREAATVRDAIADCQVAVAFTRREGAVRSSTVEMRELADLARDGKRVALVFGNEETGLTREEIEPCTHLCSIPTSDRLGSMNLSHAVAVVLARIYESLERERYPVTPGTAQSPALLRELEGMYRHWEEFLRDAGMTTGGNPERLMISLRSVFNRAVLSAQEIRVLRGILSKTQVRLGSRVRGRRTAEGGCQGIGGD